MATTCARGRMNLRAKLASLLNPPEATTHVHVATIWRCGASFGRMMAYTLGFIQKEITTAVLEHRMLKGEVFA